MKTLRVLLGLGCLAVLGGQYWTQTLAHQYGYQEALGVPLKTMRGFGHEVRIYAPWQALVWQWQWWSRTPFYVGAGGLLVLLAAVGLGRRKGQHQPPAMEGHGSTRWATASGIKQAGLYGPTGIVLARAGGWLRWLLGRDILRFDGEENVLVVGPQRSGKGAGVFIPTLLDRRRGHALTIDVRGATWKETAGYAATFSRVLCLTLTQPGSVRFSLPAAIRKGTSHEFFDAASIAEYHVDPGGGKEDHDHWEATSKAFLTMGLLYEVYTRPQPTMTHITSFWSQPGVEPFALLGYVARHAPTRPIAELAQEVLNKTAREASSVLSSMMKELFLYHDPTIAANTSCCDFLLEDFLRQDRWVSLYLVQSPGEEAYVRPFMRAFLRLALQRWLEIGDTTHAITQLLDEFPSFGRIDFLLANLAYLGGRGIRTVLGIQNIPQLRHTWGDADVIIEQCKIRLYYAANGETTGREISRQTGTGTATTVQESRRADGMSWLVPDSRTHQAQQHARSLLTDGEATQIHPTKGVLQVTGSDPIWVTKLRYWRHPTWLRRSRMPLPPMYRRPYGS